MDDAVSVAGQVCCLDMAQRDMDVLRIAVVLLIINQLCTFLTHMQYLWGALPSLKQLLLLALVIGAGTVGYHAYHASTQLNDVYQYAWAALRTLQHSPILQTSTSVVPVARSSWVSWVFGQSSEL
jgi:hypothetical protein